MEAEAQTPPASPPGRPRSAAPGLFETIVAVVVAVTGVMFLLVGALDFLRGQRIDARILGALNLAAGGTWIATAISLRYKTIMTLGIAAAGGLLAMGFTIYYASQWWRFGRNDAGLALLTIWMLVVAVGIGLTLQRTWRSYDISEQTRRRFAAGRIGIPIVATLGVLGALFQFWYSAAYGPSALPPNLAVEAHLTPVGERNDTGLRAYSVDVDLANVGESRVQVLASWYNLAAIGEMASDPDQSMRETLVSAFDQPPYVALVQPHRAESNVLIADWRPIGAGELLGRGWWFEPGESSHVQFLTFVHPSQGDVLHLNVGLQISRGFRLEPDEVEPAFECPADPVPNDVMGWTSVEPSAIRSLTTPPVRIVFGWQTGEDGTLGFTPCYGINDTWYGLDESLPADIGKLLEQEYGLAFTQAETQVSLWPEVKLTSP